MAKKRSNRRQKRVPSTKKPKAWPHKGTETRKKPKIGPHKETEPHKQPKSLAGEIPNSLFKWCFEPPFENCVWENERLSVPKLLEITAKLQHYEMWSWGEIESKKKHHHFCELENSPNKDPVKRLQERGYQKTKLFSMRITGKMRLFGYRDQAIFRIIWIDPSHRIYPSKKKHS